MEENNSSNSVIRITILAAIVVILGINVYRTEQCKKEINTLRGMVDFMLINNNAISDSVCATSPEPEVEAPRDLDLMSSAQSSTEPVQGVTREQFAELSRSVSVLESKVAALQNSGKSSAGSTTIVQGTSKEEFTRLEGSVTSMQSKIIALQSKVEVLAQSQKQMAATIKSVTNTSSETVASSRSSRTKAVSTSSNTTDWKGKVSVSAKAKVENRYVSGYTYLPKISEGPVGNVVVTIEINWGGTVTSAQINPKSTISDEDILDACKDAALRTSFSINPDAPQKQTATITYSFTAR